MRMQSTQTIAAPVPAVFDVVAHIENFAEALPHIIDHQYLSEQKRGQGTRFQETRLMGNSKHVTELLVTEYELNQRTRLVAHAGGSEWDTLFEFLSNPVGTEVRVTMDARAKNPIAWLMNKFLKNAIQKKMDRDLNDVKSHCER